MKDIEHKHKHTVVRCCSMSGCKISIAGNDKGHGLCEHVLVVSDSPVLSRKGDTETETPSVFAGMQTVARYKTPADTDIDKVCHSPF